MLHNTKRYNEEMTRRLYDKEFILENTQANKSLDGRELIIAWGARVSWSCAQILIRITRNPPPLTDRNVRHVWELLIIMRPVVVVLAERAWVAQLVQRHRQHLQAVG